MVSWKILPALALIGVLAAGCTSDNNPLAPTASEDTTPPSMPQSVVELSDNFGYRLSWAANAEADLQGYNVYRYNPDPVRENSYVKMNATILTTNTYNLPIDTSTWNYRVRAIDRAGNESALSGIVVVQGVDGTAGHGEPPGIKRGR
jgi:fibronectin type 3 domain-containing protein